MGEFAKTVQNHLCDSLAEQYPTIRWSTEYSINGTPVDIGGRNDNHVYLIELEWRRADPADNAAKIFRYIDADEDDIKQITVFQIFTNYYELSSGGISSKRKNAEFVGRMAAQAFDQLSYSPIGFDLAPPKRGENWPNTWKAIADKTVTKLSGEITAKTTS
jgi:hypothetical protein